MRFLGSDLVHSPNLYPPGLADKESKSLAQTASEELLEECGYNVPVSVFPESIRVS